MTMVHIDKLREAIPDAATVHAAAVALELAESPQMALGLQTEPRAAANG